MVSLSFLNHFRSAGFTASLLILCCAAGYGSEKELLSRAHKLTASKDYAGAEKIYRELISQFPDTGYPALARFYHRTGQTTGVAELIEKDEGFAKLPPLIKARTYTAAGMKDKSVELLRTADADSSHTAYAAALLLVNQLEHAGKKDQAAAELERFARTENLSSPDRQDLFSRLISISGSERLQAYLPDLVQSLITSTTLSYPETRKVAWDGLTVIGLDSGYTKFHNTLRENRGKTPANAWLYALSCLKKGDVPEATSALDTYSTAALTNRDKVIVHEELARLFAADQQRALSLYESILPHAPDPDRIRVEIAKLDFRLRKFDETVRVLREVNLDFLDDGEKQATANLLMTSLGATGRMDEVIKEYVRIAARLNYNLKRELATSPFIFMDPMKQLDLRQGIERSVKADKANSAAYILLMTLEHKLGNAAAIGDALELYVQENPNDLDAAMEYAQTRSNEAYQLMKADAVTSPTPQQIERTADKAARAYWNIIKHRSYVPEPYESLIDLYKLFGMEEKAKQVPLYLAEKEDASAEEIHLAAYIYAIKNYPEEAIPLYERALKMENNPRYRMNYAGALSRANRFDEAMAVYKDLIEKGHNGKSYHLHELLDGSLKFAKAAGQVASHIEYLRNLMQSKTLPDREEYILEAGKSVASAGYAQDSISFYEVLKADYPEQHDAAADYIINAHAAMGNFEEAKNLLRREIQNAKDEGTLAELRNNMALLSLRSGDLNSAVSEWDALATAMQDQRVAVRGLLSAGKALLDAGRVEQAKQYFRRYLQMDGADPDGEQIVREELEKLGGFDLPAETVVESAILEFAPDNLPTTGTKTQ